MSAGNYIYIPSISVYLYNKFFMWKIFLRLNCLPKISRPHSQWDKQENERQVPPLLAFVFWKPRPLWGLGMGMGEEQMSESTGGGAGFPSKPGWGADRIPWVPYWVPHAHPLTVLPEADWLSRGPGEVGPTKGSALHSSRTDTLSGDRTGLGHEVSSRDPEEPQLESPPLPFVVRKPPGLTWCPQSRQSNKMMNGPVHYSMVGAGGLTARFWIFFY